MHAFQPAHRTAAGWLAALVGSAALLLAMPALSQAEESNPNNYDCRALLSAGEPEAGSEEQQVKYTFFCNGPITGYQLQSQIPLTGFEASPVLTSVQTGAALKDSFSCSGEFPGYAENCVGLAKEGYERITGQFSIGTKICVEPRVDPLLTVTYASSEKNVVTQAISGPFDVGRPTGCRADAYSGSSRLNPRPPIIVHKKHKKHKTKADAKNAGSRSAGSEK